MKETSIGTAKCPYCKNEKQNPKLEGLTYCEKIHECSNCGKRFVVFAQLLWVFENRKIEGETE